MRDPYEQLEYQRIHPHLFTTMSQSVNPDGSIISYEQVTVKLREQRDKLADLIADHDSTPHHSPGDGCMADSTEMFAFILGELKKCSEGFVANYARFKRLRLKPVLFFDPNALDEDGDKGFGWVQEKGGMVK